MKQLVGIFQIATVFVGSIVGAGLSSGRELNQFFAVYGYKSLIGLLICCMAYMMIGRMIVKISLKYQLKSYYEFIVLVCGKKMGFFINMILSLFLICSTSIILAGSSAVIHQYFGIPRWVGMLVMIGCSLIFLLRKTEGLFEVNMATVPLLVIIMGAIFIGFSMKNPEMTTIGYLINLPPRREHFLPAAIVYTGFNIISIVGIIVPLSYERPDEEILVGGIRLGSIILTVVSFFIIILMMIHPEYARQYEIPILAIAGKVGGALQVALLGMIWLEMFSTQIANVFSLTKSMETLLHIEYKLGVFLVIALAIPFSLIGFSTLVDVLYPIYGIFSLILTIRCVVFYIKEKVRFVPHKSKQ